MLPKGICLSGMTKDRQSRFPSGMTERNAKTLPRCGGLWFPTSPSFNQSGVPHVRIFGRGIPQISMVSQLLFFLSSRRESASGLRGIEKSRFPSGMTEGKAKAEKKGRTGCGKKIWLFPQPEKQIPFKKRDAILRSCAPTRRCCGPQHPTGPWRSRASVLPSRRRRRCPGGSRASLRRTP